MKKNRILPQIFLIISAFVIVTGNNFCFKELFCTKVVAASKIYINQNKLNLLKGERKTLKLVNGKGKVQWKSSNNAVAAVNAKGVVTAGISGTATISGIQGKKKYYSTVVVETPAITPPRTSLIISDSIKLKISGTSRKAVWNTDNVNIASVSPSGQVIAISPGTANITATIGNLSLTCVIKIETPAINIPKNTIRPGDFFQLEITGTKIPAQWQSINPEVAIVSSEGIVIGLSTGTTTIIGTSGSHQFGCSVSVESLSLSQTSALLNIGQFTILQILGATEQVTWISSDSQVAAVNSSGMVTAVSSGKANIIGSIGSKSFVCAVTVDGLTLNYTTTQLLIDESIQLAVNGTTFPIEWQSSNDDVADVENGLVYAYSEGVTEISAIVGNRKLTCTVTVIP